MPSGRDDRDQDMLCSKIPRSDAKMLLAMKGAEKRYLRAREAADRALDSFRLFTQEEIRTRAEYEAAKQALEVLRK